MPIIQPSFLLHLRHQLLQWYDVAGRRLPWRSQPGEIPDPYSVWLSEIMLQQTTVATVIPYFQKFKRLWPTLIDFADASLEDIQVVWQGLGYYARARHMHRCAITIRQEYKGLFPQHVDHLQRLPGIGPYTAAAIAAIAFNQPVVPVDGNVLRVMARLFAIKEPLPHAKVQLAAHAQLFANEERPGDFAQALMDLGATICKPRHPLCSMCPVHTFCQGAQMGQVHNLPFKAPRPPRPQKYAEAYFFVNEQQAVGLRRRPEKGLLAGLLEVPTSSWEDHKPASFSTLKQIRHSFTHFDLTVGLVYIQPPYIFPTDCFWVPLNRLEQYPLPVLTRKIIEAALSPLNKKA
jgi:A/G-specific adenine glycosylase